jgi:hypothetical protein
MAELSEAEKAKGRRAQAVLYWVMGFFIVAPMILYWIFGTKRH